MDETEIQRKRRLSSERQKRWREKQKFQNKTDKINQTNTFPVFKEAVSSEEITKERKIQQKRILNNEYKKTWRAKLTDKSKETICTNRRVQNISHNILEKKQAQGRKAQARYAAKKKNISFKQSIENPSGKLSNIVEVEISNESTSNILCNAGPSRNGALEEIGCTHNSAMLHPLNSSVTNASNKEYQEIFNSTEYAGKEIQQKRWTSMKIIADCEASEEAKAQLAENRKKATAKRHSVLPSETCAVGPSGILCNTSYLENAAKELEQKRFKHLKISAETKPYKEAKTRLISNRKKTIAANKLHVLTSSICAAECIVESQESINVKEKDSHSSNSIILLPFKNAGTSCRNTTVFPEVGPSIICNTEPYSKFIESSLEEIVQKRHKGLKIYAENEPSEEAKARLAANREKARAANRLHILGTTTYATNLTEKTTNFSHFEETMSEVVTQERNINFIVAAQSQDRINVLEEKVGHSAHNSIILQPLNSSIRNISHKEYKAISHKEKKIRVSKKKYLFAADISLCSVCNVEKHSLGEYNMECIHCGAIHFKEQKGRTVNSCCHGGVVNIPPLSEYPTELKDLLTSNNPDAKHFRANIRAYNSSFAFATFAANIEDVQGRGPPLIKIQGQVYHYASTSLENFKGNRPRNGQIYIYDDEEKAANLRMNSEYSEINLKVEKLLRRINPYAKNYRMLRELNTTDGPEYVLNFITYKFDDQRRYNKPTTSEVAFIIESKDNCIPCVDLKVYSKQENGTETTIISQTSQHADPMTFPILFPHGDLGWTYNMLSKKGTKITPLQYFGHRLALRKNKFNPLLNAGKLTQQYIINCYVLVERQRLDFIRFNQQQLRSECYQGLVDHLERSVLNEENTVRLGNAVILPATYIGSPRSLQQLYQDSMAICRKVGRPDFFITMTCNPKWTEITNVLKNYFSPGTTVNDIPTIVTDIFQAKVKELIKDIVERQLLGPIVAYVYTIEFQKRGLPHAHILAALRTDCKLLQPQDVDRFVCAELSDEDSSLRYYQLRHMMHGPHVEGLLCWDKQKNECSKKFPKNFCEETDMSGDGFPKYRRRNNTDRLYAYHSKVNGKVHYVDNRMVVPHNPYLLKKFDCHLNVEYCASVMAVKYIHKYIHKGHDRARMEMKLGDTNEVQKYIDSRYISPMEAAWRLNSLPLHDRSHTVIRLPVHLENQQYVTFKEGSEQIALNKDCKTMLLGWFNLNKECESARKIHYCNIPEHYSWNAGSKKWIPRKRADKVIGRIVNVSPKDSERFFLKLILNRVAGATCFEDLRRHEGVIYCTYREAAIAMGLTETSEEATAVLQEAASILMPREFRKFFVYYVIGDEPSNALQLWDTFKHHLTDRNSSESEALFEIEAHFHADNRSCKEFGLPEPHSFLNPPDHFSFDSHLRKCTDIESKFNVDQRKVYDRIIHCISENQAQCFFIDGPGGTGKTFLYNGMYHKLITLQKKVICIAWTGIASILLPGGTTSHRFFNLPIDLREDGICFLKKRDKLRLKEIDVVIWDEASMIPRKALEIIDRTLRDVMNCDIHFGGKTIILGGDFRQVLPVVKKASRAQIISQCLKSSTLWKLFEIHHLKINMRVATETGNFSKWLLQIGNGDVNELEIETSSALFCSNLVQWFFEDVTDFAIDLQSRIILSPQNDEVNRVNEKILDKIPGKEIICYSIDKATLTGIDRTDTREEEATLRYPDEYLHSLTPCGMPPHKLKLKVGCIVMLIRNLSVADGLCNGTRLLVQNIHARILTAKIITGDQTGTIVNIPRIQLDTSGGHAQLPFVLYRRQFPVRLAYALTINKSQGQTFERVGLYIDRPIFAHGQLYVALSRCTSSNNIKIFIKDGHKLENIVYKEVL